jgi:hypothetical protein
MVSATRCAGEILPVHDLLKSGSFIINDIVGSCFNHFQPKHMGTIVHHFQTGLSLTFFMMIAMVFWECLIYSWSAKGFRRWEDALPKELTPEAMVPRLHQGQARARSARSVDCHGFVGDKKTWIIIKTSTGKAIIHGLINQDRELFLCIYIYIYTVCIYI